MQPTNTPQPAISTPPSFDTPKYTKWNWWIGILTTLAVVSMSIAVAGFAYLAVLAKSGVSGTEFMALLLVPFILASFPLALAALIVSIIHLKNHALAGKIKGLAITCITFSGLITAFGGLIIIGNLIGLQRVNKQVQQDRQQLQQQELSYAPHPVQEAAAIDMINGCQIHQFYYGPNKVIQSEVDAATKSASGIVLVNSDNRPWRLTATEAEGTKLLPTVSAAKQKCGNLFINSDN